MSRQLESYGYERGPDKRTAMVQACLWYLIYQWNDLGKPKSFKANVPPDIASHLKTFQVMKEIGVEFVTPDEAPQINWRETMLLNAPKEYTEKEVRAVEAELLEPEVVECGRCEHKNKQAPHSCPYRGDIDGDYETLCSCCENCEAGCADDI